MWKQPEPVKEVPLPEPQEVVLEAQTNQDVVHKLGEAEEPVVTMPMVELQGKTIVISTPEESLVKDGVVDTWKQGSKRSGIHNGVAIDPGENGGNQVTLPLLSPNG